MFGSAAWLYIKSKWHIPLTFPVYFCTDNKRMSLSNPV